MTSAVTLYTAALVVPITAPPIPDGAVAVSEGRILHVGDRRWVAATLAERGLAFTEVPWRGVLTPGLVNAHTHLQYTHMGEVGLGHYDGFSDWAKSFNPVYDAGQDWRAAAAEGARALLAAGTTTAADVVTDPEAATALHDAGLHGIAYWEVMDWTNDDWTLRGRAEVERALDALPATPGTGLSPHAPYSLEIVPLLDIPDIVRERGSRIHIHLGESAIEQELEHSHPDPWHGKGVGSLRELRDAGYGTSATDYVDHLGVLGPDCHVAHGVFLSQRDRAILRARGTAVALCPRSNAVIGLESRPSRRISTRAASSRWARTHAPLPRPSTSWVTSRSCGRLRAARATTATTSRNGCSLRRPSAGRGPWGSTSAASARATSRWARARTSRCSTSR